MQLIVKTLTGQKLNFTFEPDNTIMDIKNAVQEREGIDASQIKLIFGGKNLNDEMKISDYNLEPGSTLIMVLTLRGGF